jgi:hypothetical protein
MHCKNCNQGFEDSKIKAEIVSDLFLKVEITCKTCGSNFWTMISNEDLVESGVNLGHISQEAIGEVRWIKMPIGSDDIKVPIEGTDIVYGASNKPTEEDMEMIAEDTNFIENNLPKESTATGL